MAIEDKLQKTNFTLAGALTGITLPGLKSLGDYLLFNQTPLEQLQEPEQLLNYGIMGVGFGVALLGGALIDKIMKNSYTDSLTGAYTKGYLPTIEQDLRKRNSQYTIAFIDLDNFKPLNDRYGHQAGDYALKQVTNILNTGLRDGDFIIRYGGDEFILALTSACAQDIEKLIQRLRKKVQAIEHNGTNVGLDFSVGLVSESNSKQINLDKIIKQADQEMYHDKEHKGTGRD